MAKRGRKPKSFYEDKAKADAEVKTSVGASEKEAPTPKKASAKEKPIERPKGNGRIENGLVKVAVTPERWAIKVHGGQEKQIAVPWHHTVKYKGTFYKADERIEMDPVIAKDLLEKGVIYRQGEKPKPFTAPSLKAKIVTGFGFERREDVQGKIPAGTVEDGAKGVWEELDDD